MGSNIRLKLLIPLTLLTISCSAQQGDDATGKLNQKWDDFKVENGIKTITQGPSNAVAEIGKQVNLTCIAETPIAYWVFSKDGTDTDMQIIVGPGCSVNSPFEDHYAVDSFAGGAYCYLIVFDITKEQAGVYSCSEAQNNLFSILTVIDSPPAVTVNSTTAVVEDEIVIIECSLNYEGSVAPAPTLRPYFYWKDLNGENVSSFYDSTTETMAVSQLRVTAERTNITSYTCHVYIQLIPPATAYYASNIPSANISAVSPTIEVLYGAYVDYWILNILYITIGGTTCELVEVKCGGDGNPPPSYEFVDTKENVTIGNEQTYDLGEVGRTYTCIVQNTVRNEVYRDTSSYTPWSFTTKPDCRFPRRDNTWISAIPVEGCYNGTCACSSGYDGFNLVCNANSYPSASLYQWTGADNNANCPRVYDNVQTNGIYRCSASFDQSSSNYTGNYIFPNGTSEKNVTECYQFKGAELSTA